MEYNSLMRRQFQFSLKWLLVVLGFACAAAAFRAGSPLWWAIWLMGLGLLAGVQVYRVKRSQPDARAAYFTRASIAGVGVLHNAVARHPWTGSWLIGLAWTEATAGSHGMVLQRSA